MDFKKKEKKLNIFIDKTGLLNYTLGEPIY